MNLEYCAIGYKKKSLPKKVTDGVTKKPLQPSYTNYFGGELSGDTSDSGDSSDEFEECGANGHWDQHTGESSEISDFQILVLAGKSPSGRLGMTSPFVGFATIEVLSPTRTRSQRRINHSTTLSADLERRS